MANRYKSLKFCVELRVQVEREGNAGGRNHVVLPNIEEPVEDEVYAIPNKDFDSGCGVWQRE